MPKKEEQFDGWMQTIARLEPNISAIDAAAFYASAAISLKRIADFLDEFRPALRYINEELEKDKNKGGQRR